MKHTIECTSTLNAAAGEVWDVWADMAASPTWDPREEETRLDGPFVTGTTGWSKQKGGRAGSSFVLTLVEPTSRWVNELPLPRGRLVIDHHLHSLDDGQVLVRKTYTAHGPLAVLFAAYFSRGIRRQMPATFKALEAEAIRRSKVG
jgi:Polyketide cyclase / dehydrase and lipid transport